MTPKFDNLASLLMEMPVRIPDEKRLEIAEYIEEFPEANYQEIAAAFGLHPETIYKIAAKFGIGRGSINNMSAAKYIKSQKGKETHPARIRLDAQETEILDDWMANHRDMTLTELGKRWGVSVNNLQGTKQRVVRGRPKAAVPGILQRAAARANPPVTLPTVSRGARPMKRTADRRKKDRSKDPKYTGDVKPIFTGPHSASTTTSNTRHNPRHPPRSPMDQDKRL